MKSNIAASFACLIVCFYQISFAQDVPVLPVLQLQPYITGLSSPLDVTHAGDDRLFVVQKDGRIRIVEANGTLLPTPFLDIDPRVNSTASERGLLGLAFHPNYAENGYFYVHYNNASGATQISRFSVSAGDPNIADPNSEVFILQIAQPFSNHNGGCIKFGPDGYLYIGMGDGGSGGDPQNYSQTRTSLLGKMLRIDVNTPGAVYGIPADNPFVNDPATNDEIWAIGLRNPWRFSFDRLTGDLWIGDVGQGDWEEIDRQPANSAGGENYGWRCFEGNVAYNTSGCQGGSTYTRPVHVYDNSADGCSVTGGFVYRGSQHPLLYGLYLYADYCSGRIWALSDNGDGTYANRQMLDGANFQFTSFGEDLAGELYVTGIGNGTLYRVVDRCTGFQVDTELFFESCEGANDGAVALNLQSDNTPATVTWTGGLSGLAPANVAPGSYTYTLTDAAGCVWRETISIGAGPAPAAIEFSQNNNLLTASAGFTGYQWYLDGQPIEGATEMTYLAAVSGNYRVEATQTGAICLSVSEEMAVVVTSLEDLGIVEFKMAPNPVKDVLLLQMSAATTQRYDVQLLDASGRLVLAEALLIGAGFTTSMDMGNLPAGVYTLRISHQDGRAVAMPVLKQ